MDVPAGQTVVSNRVLFAFKDAPSAAATAEIGALTGAADVRPVGGAGAWLIDSGTLGVADLIACLSSRLDIAYAEPDAATAIAQANDGETYAELAQAIASDINSDPSGAFDAEVTSASSHHATVSVTSVAKGRWTAFATNATNTGTCTPPYEGSRAPDPWQVSIS